MKKSFGVLRSKGVKVAAAIAATFASGLAMAQEGTLPAWATEVATNADQSGTEAAALVGPVIGGVIISLIVIKLIKRFSSKI